MFNVLKLEKMGGAIKSTHVLYQGMCSSTSPKMIIGHACGWLTAKTAPFDPYATATLTNKLPYKYNTTYNSNSTVHNGNSTA